MPKTPQEILGDPNFHALPLSERFNVMRTVDPNFALLPKKEQGTVIYQAAMAALNPEGVSSDTAPADKGFIDTLIGDAVGIPEGLWNMFRHPIETTENVLAQHGATAAKAKEAFNKGDYSSALGYGASTVIPVVGPMIAQAGEELGSGQYGQGLAHTLELIAPTKVGRTGISKGAKVAGRAVPDVVKAGVKGAVKGGISKDPIFSPVIKGMYQGAKEEIEALPKPNKTSMPKPAPMEALNFDKTPRELKLDKLPRLPKRDPLTTKPTTPQAVFKPSWKIEEPNIDLQSAPVVQPGMAAQPTTNPVVPSTTRSGRTPGKPTPEMLAEPIKVQQTTPASTTSIAAPTVAPITAPVPKSTVFTMKDVPSRVRPVYEDLRKRHGMSGAGDAWTKDNQIAQYVKSLGVDRKKWMNASQAEHEAWIKQAGEKAKAAGLSKSGYKSPGLEGGRSRSYHTLVDHIGRLLELDK